MIRGDILRYMAIYIGDERQENRPRKLRDGVRGRFCFRGEGAD
jgi:hypothetical protein